MASGLHRLGVVALGEAYAAGRASAVAVTDAQLARIERFDPLLRAFTHVDAEGARAAARDSAARIDAGRARPLEGVPVALKANIDVEGWPVHGGVGALKGRIAPADAEVARRLRAAGAVLLGALNLHEAALGATTDNPFFGTTQNPWAVGHTPGGSSGGSGAAVAAGLCAAALGTDTLGSIRIPAAYCGVVGLKPTNGLVPNEGLIELVPRLDCIGPLARSVADCAAVLSALASLAPAPPIRRVALLSSTEAVDQHPAVRSALKLAASLLEGLGIEVRARHVGIDHHRLRLAGFIEAARAADAAFGADADANPAGYSERFRGYLAFARGIEPAVVEQGRRAMAAAADELCALLAMDGAILLPTTPQTAFAHGGDAPVSQADFTALANIAGLPALSLPAGWTADGLPVGVQLIGRAGQEAALIELGGRLEAALNAGRWPPDFA